MMVALANAEAHRDHRYYATISVQTFYDELSPYGEWIFTPAYGYAWRPYLDDREEFRPYSSNGEWVYTDLGWTWVSDYRWGWAAFHYGRWYFDDAMGWMWVPGNEWAPAWVTWGSYNDYWAWAPMGPAVEVSLHLNWRAPHSWWTFVPRRHFCTNNWHDYIYNKPVQINHITVINNIYNENNYRHGNGHWFHGPRVRDVEKHANTRIRKMEMVDTDRPGRYDTRNNRVTVYRPEIKNERGKPRPSSVHSDAAVKAVPRTGYTDRSRESEKNNTRSNYSTRVLPPKPSATRTAAPKVNYDEKARESVRNSNKRETPGNASTRESVKNTVPTQKPTERSSHDRSRGERTSTPVKTANR